MEQLHLVPSACPPHRNAPECSAEHRAAMVALAVSGEPRLVCDGREMQRPGKSYTIDSLIELRGELGAQQGLCMVLGCDAVQEIAAWHRWQELLDWAHIVIIARPGWQLPRVRGRWHSGSKRTSWRVQTYCGSSPCGGIVIEELRPLAISSTEIRGLLASGRSARYLTPQSVVGLYCNTQTLSLKSSGRCFMNARVNQPHGI